MEEWKVIRKVSNRRTLGTVWLVERKVMSPTGYDIERGYFKFANVKTQKYIGPLAATELIAYRLAQVINLPVAEIRLVKVGEQIGAVSLIKQAQPLYHWRQLSSRVLHDIPNLIKDSERLLNAFVFDIWICNFDRHGRNAIAYSTGDKYDFYLIDHGLSLAGALQRVKNPWNDPFWDNKVSFKYLKGTRHYIKSYDRLEPYVKQIQNIQFKNMEEDKSLTSITSIVDSIPHHFLPSKTKTILKNFLFHRQQKLPEIVQRVVKKRFN
jgi:hypothetical protein